jgi:(p)ppGpp synthase/HD superfamily hydrolase
MNVRDKALAFATAAHAAVNQVRKYTGDPYIVHPAGVAKIVAGIGGTDAMIAAALLHDTIEDTKVTRIDLENEFAQEVVDLVVWLSDVSKLEDGNRAVRKAIDRQHSADAPAAAQTIKVADLLSNFESITAYDPNFSKVYVKEMALLLDVLTKADPRLLKIAREKVAAYYGQ